MRFNLLILFSLFNLLISFSFELLADIPEVLSRDPLGGSDLAQALKVSHVYILLHLSRPRVALN